MDKETQLIAVEKVLEEMQKAEEYLNGWNASWLEQWLNAQCLPLHYEIGAEDIRDLQRKYEPRYNLYDAFYSADSIGIPLAKATLIGNNTLTGEMNKDFEVEFGKAKWYDINTNKSTRNFLFCNDGTIEFSKFNRKGQSPTIRNPRRIDYNTSYNVLSNDLDLSINVDELSERDNITISLKGNILTEKFNDIEIIRDINTGKRKVKIAKKYNKLIKKNNASVSFEAALNPDDSLEYGSVAIETHKGNGKVNGTYRFDVNKEKGVRANFYSRKGVKVDLTSNPVLLRGANTLLLSTQESNNHGDMIVSDFANSTQDAIAKNLNERVISFDNSDFNMKSVIQAEEKIIEMIKSIRGELPLQGLVDRIDNFLELMNKKENVQIEDESNCKVLKLEAPTINK